MPEIVLVMGIAVIGVYCFTWGYAAGKKSGYNTGFKACSTWVRNDMIKKPKKWIGIVEKVHNDAILRGEVTSE